MVASSSHSFSGREVESPAVLYWSMSKQHVGKTCVYCGVAPAATMDHVFAREFFPIERRANLPKVPACAACNSVKSRLEHYLTAVLPFGGTHPDALVALGEMVPPRLERNAKLKDALSAGHRQESMMQNGIIVPAMTLPFDSERAADLFRFITQGLLYHHFRVTLDRKKHGVWAGFLNAEGEQIHRNVLAKDCRERIRGDVGNGAFVYEGAQGTDFPEMSIWIFKIYGGLKTSGDPDEREIIGGLMGGLTASAGFLERMRGLFK
jgi:hypothetical protein